MKIFTTHTDKGETGNVPSILLFLFNGIDIFVRKSITSVSPIQILRGLKGLIYSIGRFFAKQFKMSVLDFLRGITMDFQKTKLINSKMPKDKQFYSLQKMNTHKIDLLRNKNIYPITKKQENNDTLKVFPIQKKRTSSPFFTLSFIFPEVLFMELNKDASILKSKILTLLTFLMNVPSKKKAGIQTKKGILYVNKERNCKFISREIGLRSFFSFFYMMKKRIERAVLGKKQIQISLALGIG